MLWSNIPLYLLLPWKLFHTQVRRRRGHLGVVCPTLPHVALFLSITSQSRGHDRACEFQINAVRPKRVETRPMIGHKLENSSIRIFSLVVEKLSRLTLLQARRLGATTPMPLQGRGHLPPRFGGPGARVLVVVHCILAHFEIS